ncbi:hypothetical protein MMC20_004850 [Loxospora ochrophaea]|nr:hypothetical protein [Loxospora ochrophaea]
MHPTLTAAAFLTLSSLTFCAPASHPSTTNPLLNFVRSLIPHQPSAPTPRSTNDFICIATGSETQQAYATYGISGDGEEDSSYFSIQYQGSNTSLYASSTLDVIQMDTNSTIPASDTGLQYDVIWSGDWDLFNFAGCTIYYDGAAYQGVTGGDVQPGVGYSSSDETCQVTFPCPPPETPFTPTPVAGCTDLADCP